MGAGVKYLLSINDLTKDEILELLDKCEKLKKSPEKYSSAMEGKTLIMLFEKPSTRTRVSFEAGVTRLGGHAIYFSPESSQISRGETLRDTAQTLARYADVVMARVYKHERLEEFSKSSSIPVINGLSDKEHPCQILADLFTMKEKNKLEGKIVYLGDGNNVCNSLVLAANTLGLDLVVSCPKGYEPKLGEANIEYDPKKAVDGADVIYTDVWISMGDEKEKEKRLKAFKPYQVNEDLVSNAKKDYLGYSKIDMTYHEEKGYIFMHCLPAHRGYEVTGGVIDGKNSVVFDQAENRMHMQNAILLELIG